MEDSLLLQARERRKGGKEEREGRFWMPWARLTDSGASAAPPGGPQRISFHRQHAAALCGLMLLETHLGFIQSVSFQSAVLRCHQPPAMDSAPTNILQKLETQLKQHV